MKRKQKARVKEEKKKITGKRPAGVKKKSDPKLVEGNGSSEGIFSEIESEATPAGESITVEATEEIHKEEGLFNEESQPLSDSSRAIVRVDRKGEIVHLDPLTLYINEIRKHPVLPPDEERRLTILYYENQDEEAAKRIILSNLRLVVKIAFEYRKAYKNVLDLIQEGNIGLLMALKKFDPYKGVRFISYAAWWIRAYILRYILNNWRMVRIGTTQTQRKLFFNLHKEKERLEKMGIKPDIGLIARRLNVDENEVMEIDKRLSATDLSLESPIRKDSDSENVKIDTMGDPSMGADELLTLAEFNDKLHSKLEDFSKTIEGKEKYIFEERLISDRPKTLQEIGDYFNITRERVRQLEARVMKKLKAFLMKEMGEYFDETTA